MIASEAAGAPFGQLLSGRVFGPARMHDTRLLRDDEIVPRRARGYSPGPHGFRNAPFISMTVTGGAGGIGSTLDDMVAFDRALREGVFGDPAWLAPMFEPVRLASGRQEGYGLGWNVSRYRGRRIVHHAGGIEGFSSLYLNVRGDDLTIIMLTNLDGYPCAGLARRLIDRGCGLVPPVPSWTSPPPAGLAARAGRYRNPILSMEVAATADGLAVTQDGRVHRMGAVDAATYADREDPDISLRFHDDEQACTLSYPLHWVTGYRSDST